MFVYVPSHLALSVHLCLFCIFYTVFGGQGAISGYKQLYIGGCAWWAGTGSLVACNHRKILLRLDFILEDIFTRYLKKASNLKARQKKQKQERNYEELEKNAGDRSKRQISIFNTLQGRESYHNQEVGTACSKKESLGK